jgi:hypothetical protein
LDEPRIRKSDTEGFLGRCGERPERTALAEERRQQDAFAEYDIARAKPGGLIEPRDGLQQCLDDQRSGDDVECRGNGVEPVVLGVESREQRHDHQCMRGGQQPGQRHDDAEHRVRCLSPDVRGVGCEEMKSECEHRQGHGCELKQRVGGAGESGLRRMVEINRNGGGGECAEREENAAQPEGEARENVREGDNRCPNAEAGQSREGDESGAPGEGKRRTGREGENEREGED